MTPTSFPGIEPRPVAVITGGSRGLGHALAAALLDRDWQVVIDGRDESRLAAATRELADHGPVRAVPGDIADRLHRARLAEAALDAGGPHLLVHNASTLGIPAGRDELPHLAELDESDLLRTFAINATAPLALTRLVLEPLEARAGRIIGISSDAAVEAYPGWGGYGASKAALDQLLAVLAVEHPALRVYGLDPGDMRTELAAEAFPGEDISDRPEPATVVPGLLRLIDADLPSRRYTLAELVERVPA
jgi:NAD(P)-dependent dehydrogenase (short-subunit alcohol dehydrogenase family)